MSYYKQFKDYTTSLDLFGHQVTLNFNRKGDTHQTLPGGIVSLIIRVILLLYFVDCSIAMFKYKNNELSDQSSIADLEEVGEVDLNEENVLLFLRAFMIGDP